MSKVGATVKDVPAQDFVVALAGHFKKTQKLNVPAYHDLIKTATYKELCPQDPDWYYVRAASVARKIYLRGGIGVGAFQKIYGGAKSNGSRRPHFAKAAAGIHRNILQALTEIDLVAKKKDKKSAHAHSTGRRDRGGERQERYGQVDVAAADSVGSAVRSASEASEGGVQSVQCDVVPFYPLPALQTDRVMSCFYRAVLLRASRGRWITRSGQRELDTIASQLVATRKTAAASAAAAAAAAAAASAPAAAAQAE